MSEALTKELFNRCKKLDVIGFTLSFEGGSDEGYLEVDLRITEKRLNGKASWSFIQNSPEHSKLADDLYNWADRTYRYNGAGDGNRYGDRYDYDLVNKTVSHQEWWTAYQEGGVDTDSLETC